MPTNRTTRQLLSDLRDIRRSITPDLHQRIASLLSDAYRADQKKRSALCEQYNRRAANMIQKAKRQIEQERNP